MAAVRTSLESGVGRLVVSHPPVNILTRDVLAGIRAGLEQLAPDPSLRVLLLSAAGKHFSAGASVEEHLPPLYDDLIPEFMATVSAVDAFPLPVIAAVQGRCLGGGLEVVLAADIIVAATNARFGQPEILLGVVPPAACALLPTLTSRGVAAQLVYTGDPLSAEEARAAGIVTQVVEDDELEDAALALAGRIARHSGAALRIAKQSLRHDESGRTNAFSRATSLYVESLMRTQDAVEGLQAFLDKREPVWSHQ